MKQKIISFCMACFLVVAHGYCGVTLTVPDVSVAPGGTASVVINFDLGTESYTAYQMDISYPDGISSVSNEAGKPSFIKGDVYDDEHNVSSTYTSVGLDRYQCFSINSKPFTSQSGTLLTLTISAKSSMEEGSYEATISPIEFVTTGGTPDRPEAVTFNIKVTKNIVLDETSTIVPEAANNVNVTVKRTITAGNWSTICLPFAMTEEQVKTAFGDDVELADFVDYEATYDENDDAVVTALTVNFTEATAIAANHPYIIKVANDISQFTVKGIDIVPDEDGACIENDNGKTGNRRVVYSGFYGTYHAGTAIPKFGLFLSGGKFWYSLGLTETQAYRGWFEFFDVLTSVENEDSANLIKMRFSDGTEYITEIEGGYRQAEQTTAIDLLGRHVKNTERGFYIENGKKIFQVK